MRTVDRTAVTRFRLAKHHLATRLPAAGLAGAVGVSGIQETPRRTAAVALHARLSGLEPADITAAVDTERRLLVVWAMRGAPYLVPVEEAAVFTTGALPPSERSMKTFFGGWAAPVAAHGATFGEVTGRAAAAAREALDGRQLAVDDLRHEIASRMPEIRDLQPPSGAHADLPEPLFRLLGPMGVVCITDVRRMTDALVGRIDQWLDRPVPALPADAARIALLRRYLRCYGPATPQAFAEWVAWHPADARALFDTIADELTEISVTEDSDVVATGVVLSEDADELAGDLAVTGVRLLPPQDPFLQQRDRALLLPDAARRRRLWRPVGAPGLVLVDGEPAGLWRSSRRGKRLAVVVEPFSTLPSAARDAIATEADGVARVQGAGGAALEVG